MSFAGIDWKLVAAVVATVVSVASFLPYYRQILRRETQPHAYTWLIWSLTIGTAAAGVWFGGGGFAGVGMAISVLLAFSVFLLSFKYGTKNVTRGDAFVLIGALIAIFVWWGLDNPALAVILATGIDTVGYVPTYRKLFQEPWSEDLVTWVGFSLAPALGFASLYEYNVLTMTYVGITFFANVFLVTLMLIRRQNIPKPVQK